MYLRDIQKIDLALRGAVPPKSFLVGLEDVKDGLAFPGLPDLTEALSRGQVDIERFLEIRQSADGEEFRRWLRNQGPDGVAALRDQWGRLRSRLGAWVATPAGRGVRFLVSSGVGVVSGAAGIATSAIDSFLLERWLPRSQPLSFLLHSYKSIFREPS